MTTAEPEALVSVRGLTKTFPVKGGLLDRQIGQVRAVDDLDFDIASGETLGLVGESGSGKTTVSRMLIRLLAPSGGSITFDGSDIGSIRGAGLRQMRRDMQIVFQDPFGSLDPRMTVRRIIAEPLVVDGRMTRAERQRRVADLMDMVGLPRAYENRHPHQFSGGQRQRIGIARALALGPRFLICDEAVSALDLSVQAQIINLLGKLQRDLKLTTLFVSHDLQVVRHISDRVAVMYLGRLVELAPTRHLFDRPLHPYAKMLLGSAPSLRNSAGAARQPAPASEMPSPMSPPSGCLFHPRCPAATEICKLERPATRDLAGNRSVACHHA